MAHLPEDLTVEQAQASMDKWCTQRGDTRMRRAGPDGKATVATIVQREPLAPIPLAPFPATVVEQRMVSAHVFVSVWRSSTGTA